MNTSPEAFPGDPEITKEISSEEFADGVLNHPKHWVQRALARSFKKKKKAQTYRYLPGLGSSKEGLLASAALLGLQAKVGAGSMGGACLPVRLLPDLGGVGGGCGSAGM